MRVKIPNRFLLLCSTLFIPLLSPAQTDAEELAKKLANPISSLISLPFQNNSDFGIGKLNGSRNTLNIQPVIPVSLNEKLNLITRVIVPVISQYNITGAGEKQTGMADWVASAFISPAQTKNGITWGAGPVFLLPFGTSDYLTTEKLGLGPTAVALKQTGGITYGALANQIWSVSGDENRADVNQFFLQPFLTYNWKSGAGLGLNFEWTQYWDDEESLIWLNPVASGVTSLGKQKVQFAAGPRFNLAAPGDSEADFGVRAALVFLFPK